MKLISSVRSYCLLLVLLIEPITGHPLFFPFSAHLRLPNLFTIHRRPTAVLEHRIPLNLRRFAPNPINFDIGISKRLSKRQSLESVENSATVNNLLDSFSGNTNSVTANQVNSNLEDDSAGSKPQTGVYYLVDWNSFLEVDDQNGRRVNLRFQPKTGSPKRFFSVTVP